MAQNPKIVIVGGGDYKITPKLIGDILTTKKLDGSTIILYDRDANALNVVFKLAQKMKEMEEK